MSRVIEPVDSHPTNRTVRLVAADCTGTAMALTIAETAPDHEVTTTERSSAFGESIGHSGVAAFSP